MKKFLKIFLPILFVVVAVSVWVLTQSTPVTAPVVEPNVTESSSDVLMVVAMPDGQDRIITQFYQPDQTIFEFMQASTLAIEYDEYDFGNLITGIEGIKSGTDNKYWIYYINGDLAQVGVSDYVLQPGDKVTWSFEEEKEGI